MIVSPIYPRYHSWLYPTCILQFARFAHIGNQGTLNEVFHTADNGDAPWAVPFASESYLVHIGGYSQQFAVGIKAGCALIALDVCLRQQHEYTILRFYQHGESPAQVVTLGRLNHPSHTANGLNFACSAQGKESLVAVGPLHHPAFGTLWNLIGGKFFGQFAFQSAQFVAERNTIVVKAQHKLQIAAQSSLVFIGFVGANRFFTSYHLVVGFHHAGKLPF